MRITGNTMTIGKILLIEDNPDDELLTIRALKKNNIVNDIIVKRDGVEALDYLFGTGSHSSIDSHEMPQLILLDLKLPKLDGLEVLKRIRGSEHTRFIPIVILTTSNEQQDIMKSYEDGANSYIRKPVDFDQFVESVKQLGMYWLVLNEAPVLK